MANAPKSGPQDLPPPGGYGPIQTERIKLRGIIGARGAFGIFAVTAIGGIFGLYWNEKALRRNRLEMASARNAITPLLMAERDRAVLKHLRRIRDEEAEVMKDVPEWEVGTLFGHPVWKSYPKDAYIEPAFSEYYAHAGLDDLSLSIYDTSV